jgi:S1-C subfamily serine protease
MKQKSSISAFYYCLGQVFAGQSIPSWGRRKKGNGLIPSANRAIDSDTMTRKVKSRNNARDRGSQMPDQYRKLIGYTFKYPYLVGISTESGNLGTGILISARFVLTCGHVLHDSRSAEVISQDGITSARVQKMDDSLDLALLELTRPISVAKAKFTDSALQPGAILWAVGVQETPGQPNELSVAEIELKYRNANDADGKILDIQLEGGARPGYSGGPVVAEERGVLRCVGVMQLGGHGASSSNAIGLASIRAFVADYIPDMQEDKRAEGISRLVIFAAIVFGVLVAGAIAEWRYLASHSPKVTSGKVTVDAPEPEKTEAGQTVLRKNTPTDAANVPSSTGLRPDQQGRPDVRVWVNTASNVYHCPRTQRYGNTLHGKYMTQAEAQKQAIRPAYGKVCK